MRASLLVYTQDPKFLRLFRYQGIVQIVVHLRIKFVGTFRLSPYYNRRRIENTFTVDLTL